MIRIEWVCRMALGAVAYAIWCGIGSPIKGAFSLWLLSHAGFFAFDTGYADYARRSTGMISRMRK